MNSLREIIQFISKELNVDVSVVCENFKKSLAKEEKEFEKNDQIEGKDTSKKREIKKKKKSSDSICKYVYQRGEKKGQKCEFAVKESDMYCSRHNKKDDEKKKDKVVNKKIEAVKIISKLMNNRSVLEIRKNNFNNYETENNLLYDIENKEIYGYQLSDGKFRDLFKSEIEWCKERNLKFKYPFNMSLENMDDSLEKVEKKEEYEEEGDFDDCEECFEEVEDDE